MAFYRGVAFAALTVLLAAAQPAAAQRSSLPDHNRYKWRDSEGNLHYADIPTPEAVRLGYEVISPQGIVIRRVERTKTPEELAAAKAAQAKAQADLQEAALRSRSDSQMLVAFPAEADLLRTQQQQLDLLDQTIKAARISLRSQEGTLADQLAHADELEQAGKPVPVVLTNRILDLREQIDTHRKLIARKEQERVETAERFEADAAHYRKLKLAQDERAH